MAIYAAVPRLFSLSTFIYRKRIYIPDARSPFLRNQHPTRLLLCNHGRIMYQTTGPWAQTCNWSHKLFYIGARHILVVFASFCSGVVSLNGRCVSRCCCVCPFLQFSCISFWKSCVSSSDIMQVKARGFPAIYPR